MLEGQERVGEQIRKLGRQLGVAVDALVRIEAGLGNPKLIAQQALDQVSEDLPPEESDDADDQATEQ